LKLVFNGQADIFWHTRQAEDIELELKTNILTGLSEAAVRERLEEIGPNELEEKKGRSPFKIFMSQFNDFMIWILIAAALISGIVIREVTDAIVILVILVINSVLGFVQEYRAEKALAALKELAAPTALILRDGVEQNLPSRVVVPGDIIKLTAGDLVPADCRVIYQVNLQANESIITGESLPVDKSTKALKKENLPLGDRINMLFSGTTITKGRCSAIVTGTGKNTELGKIASLVQSKDEQTPLQKELKTVGTRIGIICLSVSAVVFVAGMLKGFIAISQGAVTATRGDILSEMFLVAVALAVASIPEGLPAIVTISLALGVQKMAKNNAIVRRLSSVETLGSVSVICTDKTGTLTQNRMTVRKIYTGLDEYSEYENLKRNGSPSMPVCDEKQDSGGTGVDGINPGETSGRESKGDAAKDVYLYQDNMVPKDAISLKFLIENAVLCNDAYYIDKESRKLAGDPTETALIELGSFYSLGKESLEFMLPREYEEPFDSVRKMMSTVHRISEDYFFSKHAKLVSGDSTVSADKPDGGAEAAVDRPKDSSGTAKSAAVLGSRSDNTLNITRDDMPVDFPEYILFCKGAPEMIVKKCTKIIKGSAIEDLTDSDRDRIFQINTDLANGAMRNLAFAFKYISDVPEGRKIEGLENELIFNGMVGMIDPPRPEVFDAVAKCKKAGINIIMVTGDHKLTAKAIGEELGILEADDRIVDEEEFSRMAEGQLIGEIENIKVFARVSPEHKVEIVEALKKRDHIVAMTGDGINDAPSLKKADIGLAMGISGTDVSKEASDMILTDDNFATIVKAIREGRVIYDNLKKFILFLLSCNMSEVLLMFVAIVFGSFIFRLLGMDPLMAYLPLLPVQILWMNLVTDGFPALALGINPAEPNIMDRIITKRRERILSRSRLFQTVWQGLTLTLGALFMYFVGPILFNTHSLGHDTDVFHTCVFSTLVITQLLHSFNFRFEEKGIFRKGIFANRFLNISVLASIVLQIAIIYAPFLQKVFSTTGLNIYQWLAVLVCSAVPVIIINLVNEILGARRRKALYN
jgi:P-type Ca2+ transporter type 2C